MDSEPNMINFIVQYTPFIKSEIELFLCNIDSVREKEKMNDDKFYIPQLKIVF